MSFGRAGGRVDRVSSEQPAQALEPYLPWGPPTDELRLFTGPLSFVPAGRDPLPAALGRIDLLLRSGSHLNWSVDLDGVEEVTRRAWERGAGARAEGELTFNLYGCPTRLRAAASTIGEGIVQTGTSSTPGAEIDRIVVHLANVPDLSPTIRVRGGEVPGQPAEWHGRRVVDAPPWRMTFDSRPDLRDAYRTARRSYLSVLTHTLTIRRLDGHQFSADEAQRILSDAHVGLSFPLGRWAAPVLPIGLSADGTPVASFWGAWHADTPAIDADRWWPGFHREFLDDYLPKFVSAREDPTERRHLQFLIASSLATGQQAFLEQRVSIALAAIEYLSWVDEVVTATKTTEKWRKYSAAQRIRRRLINACIPVKINPARSPQIAAFAKLHGIDAPSALTLVRDEVTHPKDRQLLDDLTGPLANAARLSSRYLDLLILHRLGYQGWTRDRTKTTGFEGEEERVPWATEGS